MRSQRIGAAVQVNRILMADVFMNYKPLCLTLSFWKGAKNGKTFFLNKIIVCCSWCLCTLGCACPPPTRWTCVRSEDTGCSLTCPSEEAEEDQISFLRWPRGAGLPSRLARRRWTLRASCASRPSSPELEPDKSNQIKFSFVAILQWKKSYECSIRFGFWLG